MQSITTRWHGEVWWFSVQLATNITFIIVFFWTSPLHLLSLASLLSESFGQLAALLHHDSTVKHRLASSSLCYHLQLWLQLQLQLVSLILHFRFWCCFMYDMLVWFTSKLECWEFDTLLCKKNERGLVYATQSGGPQKTSRSKISTVWNIMAFSAIYAIYAIYG